MLSHCDTVLFHSRCVFPCALHQAARPLCSLCLGRELGCRDESRTCLYIRNKADFGVLKAPRGDYILGRKSSRDLAKGKQENRKEQKKRLIL